MEVSFKNFALVYVVTDCSTIPARHFVTVVRLMHSTQCRNTSLSSLLNKYLQNNDGLFFLDFVVTVAISPMFLKSSYDNNCNNDDDYKAIALI